MNGDEQISIEVVWKDDDMVELRILAANSQFRGTAYLYETVDQLAKLAQALRGFPRGKDDEREFSLGAPSDDYAGGAATLRFVCFDVVGHAEAEIRLKSSYRDSHVLRQQALVAVKVEASAIDRFVRQLESMSDTWEGRAVLGFGLG